MLSATVRLVQRLTGFELVKDNLILQLNAIGTIHR